MFLKPQIPRLKVVVCDFCICCTSCPPERCCWAVIVNDPTMPLPNETKWDRWQLTSHAALKHLILINLAISGGLTTHSLSIQFSSTSLWLKLCTSTLKQIGHLNMLPYVRLVHFKDRSLLIWAQMAQSKYCTIWLIGAIKHHNVLIVMYPLCSWGGGGVLPPYLLPLFSDVWWAVLYQCTVCSVACQSPTKREAGVRLNE